MTDVTPVLWAVGEHGTVLSSSDGGSQWLRQETGSRQTLAGVAFADCENGWAVGFGTGGDEGAILRTGDGGEQWEILRLLPGTILRDVCCVDSLHVWVSGQCDLRPLILGSIDGGDTWEQQAIGTMGEVVTCIRFVDEKHGWAGTVIDRSPGFWGHLMRSCDGGLHWEANGALPVGIESLTAISEGTCWIAGMAVGDASVGRVARIDGSDILWRQPRNLVGTPRYVFTVGDSAVGVLGAQEVDASMTGVFWLSRDGGINWIGTGMYPYYPKAAAFTDAAHGWSVGKLAGNYGSGVILSTSDGGLNWTKCYGRPDTPVLRDVTCVSSWKRHGVGKPLNNAQGRADAAKGSPSASVSPLPTPGKTGETTARCGRA